MNNKIIVVAPTIYPEICGVSDYAMNLCKSLKSNYYEIVELGLERCYITEATKLNRIQHWEILLVDAIKTKESVDVLINYTPRSYSRFGYPYKLIGFLKKLRSVNPNNKVFVIFHEIWNDDSKLRIHHRIIGKSSKLFAKHLGVLSNGFIAMTMEQKELIQKLMPNISIDLGLVGANVLPKNREEGLLSIRNKGVWSVFGLSHTRLWTLQKYQTFILEMAVLGFVKEIRLIGPFNDHNGRLESEFINKHFKNITVKQLGSLSIEEVNIELLSTSVGLIGQSEDSISKSGTFAALAAYGVPMICDVSEKLTNPPGESFFNTNELILDLAIFDKEKTARTKIIHDWFWETRSWEAIGENVFDFIKDNR